MDDEFQIRATECKQLEVTTDKVGESLFGQVSRGTLAVTAKMASLTEIAALHGGYDAELIKEMMITPECGSQIACNIKWNWDIDDAETPSHLADEILALALSSCFYLRSGITQMFGLIIYPAETPGE